MLKKNIFFIFVVFLDLTFLGCRGDKSSSPPILPIQNMVEQTSYGPQSKNEFFKDKSATRPSVHGTVAQGEEFTNSKFYKGIEAGSIEPNDLNLDKVQWVNKFPTRLSKDLVKLGQEKYNIYCSGCHGYSGHNDGLVTVAAGGSIRPADIFDKDKLKLPLGRLFYVVSNGVNNWNMPGFSEQLSAKERWALVAYVKSLQTYELKKASDVNKKSELSK